MKSERSQPAYGHEEETMSDDTVKEQPGDSHKRNVAEFFSQTTQYWVDAYSPSGASCESFDVFAKQRRKQLVLEVLDRRAAGRQLSVLDVGCGPGLFLEAAAWRGHRVHGVDLSERMVLESNKRLGQYLPGRVPCQQGDIERLPFENDSMDVVLCLGVLPYLRDDRAAIREISRVLKDGGFAIILLPNLIKMGNLLDPYYYLVRGWQYLWYRLFNADAVTRRILDPDRFGANSMFGIRRYSPAQVRSLFPEPGFSVDEASGIDYGPLTFWKWRVLPDRLSIAASRLLTRAGQRKGRSWLAGMANEIVLCITSNKNLTK